MKRYSPTTPSRRQMTTVDYSGLSKVKPYKKLLVKLKQRAGRNSAGRITVRHQGGGNKRLYRMVDFKQQKLNMPAKVKTLEYDPYRSAFICLIEYTDGTKSYILAPIGLVPGRDIIFAENAPAKIGNRATLQNIPVGTQIYNVELVPGQGGKLARSAGNSVYLNALDQGYADIKMSSGEVRRVPWKCWASIGQVSNAEHNLTVLGKAGRSRHLGIRPTVRGTAMNPVDHPHGGGEGRQPRGTRRPKTLWGKVTGGHKTRKRSRSNKFILKRRTK